jgi:enoyl-CoA hydratase
MTASDSSDDRVLFEIDPEKRIATITLNNPKQRNSYDARMREAVARCLDRVADDDDLTVVLLRGADGVFSTGADMNNAYGWYGERSSEQPGDSETRSAESRPSQRRRLTVDRKSFSFYHNLMGFPKVTVGEISGYALGGGFEIALMTDISVIARDTKIGMPATRFLGPALGSLHMFFHRLGPVLARRLLLTGDIIDAEAVENLGDLRSRPSGRTGPVLGGEGRQDAGRRRCHCEGGISAGRAEPGVSGRRSCQLPLPCIRHKPAVRTGGVQLRQNARAARDQGGIPPS